MNITHIQALPLNLKFKTPLASSQWTYDDIANVLVRIECSDGTVGFGEGAPLPHFSGETQAGVISQIRDHLAPVLTGRDPFDTVAALDRMNRALGWSQTAKAALDMALHDVIGKRLGVPVYKLLGGQVQDGFTSCRAIGFDEPDFMIQNVIDYQNEGFTTFEVKMDEDPWLSLTRIIALLDAAPADNVYFFDPNEAWSLSDCLAVGRRIPHERGNFYFEQPIAKENLAGMEEIRRVTGIPLSADESVQGPASVLALVRAHATDILNLKLTKVGGFRPALQCAAIAEAAGIDYRVDTMVETKIGNSAHSHLAAATHQVLGAIDPHLNLQRDPVVEGGLVLAGGRVTVPTEPGLGVILDEAVSTAGWN